MPGWRKREPLPDFPIEQILIHLGADSVPTGTGWRRMRCPFHEDRTASASVSTTAFRCHSCEVRGDALKLLQTQLNLSFVEALNLARELTGIGAASSRPRKKRRPSELLGGLQ